MTKISYIIPCYNVEQYVNRCIKSLYNQGLETKDFEVIAVNDGSTDETAAILHSLDYPNLIIIDQDNEGLSTARNVGLKVARGEYVWFIDSDDYIKPNITTDLLRIATDNKLDILFFGLEEIRDNTPRILWHQELENNAILDGATAILSGYSPNSACSGLYRLEFLKSNPSLVFVPKLYHQDVQFNYRAVTLAERVEFIKTAPYIYELHSDSISQSTSPEKAIKRLVDDAIIADSFRTFASTLGNKALARRILIQATSIIIGLLLQLRGHGPATRKNVINKLREYNLYPVKGPFKSISQRLAAYFLNLYFAWV